MPIRHIATVVAILELWSRAKMSLFAAVCNRAEDETAVLQ